MPLENFLFLQYLVLFLSAIDTHVHTILNILITRIKALLPSFPRRINLGLKPRFLVSPGLELRRNYVIDETLEKGYTRGIY